MFFPHCDLQFLHNVLDSNLRCQAGPTQVADGAASGTAKSHQVQRGKPRLQEAALPGILENRKGEFERGRREAQGVGERL